MQISLFFGSEGTSGVGVPTLVPIITSNGGGDTGSVDILSGALYVTTVTVTNIDGVGDTIFSISGGADAAFFAIGTITGTLEFLDAQNHTNPQDANSDNIYEVEVKAERSPAGFDTQLLYVQVVASLQNTAPVMTSFGGVAEVLLDREEGVTQVGFVSAQDSDLPAQTLTYSLYSSPDIARFNINSSTGALSFTVPPVYASPTDANGDNTYEVRVRALDPLSAYAEQLIKVRINPAPGSVNTAPEIVSLGGGSTAATQVQEGQSLVGTVVATDAQNDVITYSISGGADQGLFSIGSASGVLSFINPPEVDNPLDANSDNIYEVTVQASDGVLSATQAIQVIVVAQPPVSEDWVYPPAGIHSVAPSQPNMGLLAYLQRQEIENYNTELIRISDPDLFDPTSAAFKPKHPSRSVWSHDGSLLFLDYGTTYGYLLNGDTYELIRREEIRDRIWSPVSRHAYGPATSSGMATWNRYDPDTGTWTTLQSYSQYSSFYTGGRGDISNDGTRVAVIANRSGNTGSDVLVLNPTNGDIISTWVLPSGYNPADHVQAALISQSGQFVAVALKLDNDNPALRGWRIRDSSNMSAIHLIPGVTLPLDVDIGFDSAGRECLVTRHNSGNGVVAYPLTGEGGTTVLQSSDLAENFTISCRNVDRPGYAYISTYRDSNTGTPLYRQLFALKLDGTRTVEIFTEGFFAQDPITPPNPIQRRSYGVPNRVGTRIAFGTDWYVNAVNAKIHALVVEASQPSGVIDSDVYVDGSLSFTRMNASGSFLDINLPASSAGETQIVVLNITPASEIISSLGSNFNRLYVSNNTEGSVSVWTRYVTTSTQAETIRFSFANAANRGLALNWSVRNEVYGVLGLLDNSNDSTITSPAYQITKEGSTLFYVGTTHLLGRAINLAPGGTATFIGQSSPFGADQGPDAALALKEPADVTLHPELNWTMNSGSPSTGLTIAVGPYSGESEEDPRLAALWPFASNSPWNTPVGSGAQHSQTGTDVTNVVRNTSTGVTVYTGAHAIPVYRAANSDPLVRVTVTAPDSLSPAGVVQIRIPQGAKGSLPEWDSGTFTDSTMIVIEPSGSVAHEFWRMRETSPGEWEALAYTPTPLDGSGVELVIGLSHTGYQIEGQLGWAVARTSGVSALGGLIRKGELSSGILRHALAVSAPKGSLKTPWMWPASKSRESYSPEGPLLLGSLLVLPKSVNIQTLGLNAEELVVAKALQDFGAYIVTDEPTWGIYCEATVGNEAASLRNEKLAQLWSLMVRVENNTASAVGGGGSPLAPVAPPLVFEGSGGSSDELLVLFDTTTSVPSTIFGAVNHDFGYFPKDVSVVSWHGGLVGTVTVNGRSISRATAATMLQFMILNENKTSGWTDSDYNFEALAAYVDILPVGVKLVINVYCNLSGETVTSYEGNWQIPSISAARYSDALIRLVNAFGSNIAGVELTNEPPPSLFGGTETGNWMNAWAGSAELFAQQARVVKQTLTSISSSIPVIGPSWLNLESWTTSAFPSLFNQSSDGGLDAGFGTGSGVYKDWIDVVGIHGKASSLLRFREGIRETKNAMASASVSKPLWITRWRGENLSGEIVSAEVDTWQWFDRVLVCISENVGLFVHESWSYSPAYQGPSGEAAVGRARLDALADWLLSGDLEKAVVLNDGRVRVWRDDGVIVTSGTLPSSISLPIAGQGRTLQKHPFRNDDPWNTPLTSAATWSTSGQPVTDLRSYRTVSSFGATSSDNAYPKVYAALGDPLVTVHVEGMSGRTGDIQIRIPFVAEASTPVWTGPGSSDAFLIVCDPDKIVVHEFYQFRWTNSARTTAAATSYMRTRTDSWGVMYVGLGTMTPLLPNTFATSWWQHPDGLGGISAAHYGGSIHAGLIQQGDFTSNPWGYIPHALSVRLNVDMVDGTILDPQWPASRQDGNSDIRGQIKVGTLFGLPSSVDIESLGLSAPGKILAYTLQNYGAYVTGVGASAAGGNPGTFFHIDSNSSSAEKAALLTALGDYQSILRPLLAICTNNDPLDQKGGGTPLVDKNADEHYFVDDTVDPVPPGYLAVPRSFFGMGSKFQPFYWTGELPNPNSYGYAQYYDGEDSQAKYTNLNWVVEDKEGFAALDSWVGLHGGRGHKVRIGAMINKARRDQTLQVVSDTLTQAISRYGSALGAFNVPRDLKQLLPDPINLTEDWTGNPSVTADIDGWVIIAKTTGTANENRRATFSEVGDAAVCLGLLANTSSVVSLGLDASGWGVEENSSAEVLFGPGVVTRVNGALFTVSGLEAEYPTYVRIRRKVDVGPYVFRIYPGGSSSTTSGASVLVHQPFAASGYETLPYYSLFRTKNRVLIRDTKCRAGWLGETLVSAPDAYGWVTLTRNAPWFDVYRYVEIHEEIGGVTGRVELLAGTTDVLEIMVVFGDVWELPARTEAKILNSSGAIVNLLNSASWWRITGLSSSEPTVLNFRAHAPEGIVRSNYKVYLIVGGSSSTNPAHTIKLRNLVLEEGGRESITGHDYGEVPAWAVSPTEELSNGSFVAGLTNWTVTGASGSNGVFTQTGGGVRIQYDSNPITLSQAGALTVGKTYRLSWDQVAVGYLSVSGSDTTFPLGGNTGSITFEADSTTLTLTTQGASGNVFLRSLSLREVLREGPVSHYDYYAQYANTVRSLAIGIDTVGPEIPNIDSLNRKELINYLKAEDQWGNSVASLLNKVVVGTRLNLASLQNGYATEWSALKGELVSEGLGSVRLGCHRFWITRVGTSQANASALNVRRWYTLAVMAAVQEGIEDFTFYEFASDGLNSAFNDPGPTGDEARFWFERLNAWWQADLIQSITLGGDGTGRAVRADGRELIVLSDQVILPEYDPETIETFYTLTGWAKNVVGANADILLKEGGGVLVPDTLNFKTLAGAGSNATISRDLSWNLAAQDGFWMLHRVNRRNASVGLGLTLVLSNSSNLGPNRFSATAAVWNGSVSEGSSWVPKSAFSVANGSPDWNDPILSYSFQVASHSSAVRDFDLLGIVHKKERACVVFTNDIGYDSVATAALPLHVARNIPLTCFVDPSVLGSGGYLSYVQAQAILDAGYQLGLCGAASWAADTDRISSDKDAAVALGLDYVYAAYPGGDIGEGDDWVATVTALNLEGIDAVRLTGGGTPILREHTNVKAIPSFLLTSANSLAAAKAAVDRAISAGGTVVFQGFEYGVSATATRWATSDLEELLDYVESKVTAGEITSWTFAEWWSGSPYVAPGPIISPPENTPNLVADYDIRTATEGPLLTPDVSFARASACLAKDYRDYWVLCSTGELPLAGGRRIDHSDAVDYGWGALGIEWVNTDESEDPLTMNELRGLQIEPAQTNIVWSNSDLTTGAWERRGTLSSGGITTDTDPQVAGTYSKIRGMTGPGANDVYQMLTGLVASTRYESKFMIRRVNNSVGTLAFNNPMTGEDGSWNINLANLPNNQWVEVDRDHPQVVVNFDHVVSSNGVLGVHLYREIGVDPIDFDISLITMTQGERASLSLILNTSTSAAATREGGVFTIGNLDLSEGFTSAVALEMTKYSSPTAVGYSVHNSSDAGDDAAQFIGSNVSFSIVEGGSLVTQKNLGSRAAGRYIATIATRESDHYFRLTNEVLSGTEVGTASVDTDEVQLGGSNRNAANNMAAFFVAWAVYDQRLTNSEIADVMQAMNQLLP